MRQDHQEAPSKALPDLTGQASPTAPSCRQGGVAAAGAETDAAPKRYRAHLLAWLHNTWQLDAGRTCRRWPPIK